METMALSLTMAVMALSQAFTIYALIKKLPKTDIDIVQGMSYTILKSYEDGQNGVFESIRIKEAQAAQAELDARPEDPEEGLRNEVDKWADNESDSILKVGTND